MMNIENTGDNLTPPFAQMAFTYEPYGSVIVLDYKPAEKAGVLHLPQGVKPTFDFITCKVLAAGPAVDQAKAGKWVLLATKAIMKVDHDGRTIYVTQENTILAVVR